MTEKLLTGTLNKNQTKQKNGSLILSEIQQKKARNVQKQDYRTYFPDAAIQSIVIIRNSVILQ